VGGAGVTPASQPRTAVTPAIRPLGAPDLDDCLRLAIRRDWAPEATKWRLLLDVGAGAGIERDDGAGLAGTVIAIDMDGSLGAVAMLLVDPGHDRRGWGGALMEHALDRLDRRPTFLYATEQGRPLYERLGFVIVGALVKHTAPRSALRLPAPGTDARSLRPGDIDAVIALDRDAFGVPRHGVLAALLDVASSAVVLETDERITGYALAWPNWDKSVIGPVVARTVEDAASLVAYLAALEPGRELRIDVPHTQPHLRALLRSWGFTPQPPVPTMLLGARALPGDRDRLFAVSCQGLG